MKCFLNHTNPCSWKHLQRETPYSDIYVVSTVLIYHFLLLIAWKLYISVLHFKLLNLPEILFFLLPNMHSATLSFVYKNITWKFNSFLCKRFHFFVVQFDTSITFHPQKELQHVQIIIILFPRLTVHPIILFQIIQCVKYILNKMCEYSQLYYKPI